MIGQVARRGLRAAAALLIVTAVVFALVHLSGDPTYVLLAPEATPEQRAQFRATYGLDRPLPVQYLSYLGRLAQGDFGQSFSFQTPAAAVVLQRLPATLELTVAAMVLAVAVALPAAVLAALRRGTAFDRLLMAVTLVGQSVPTFWLGMMMILVVAVRFHLLPASGRGTLAHLVMPAVALSLWLMALLARVTRSEMLEVLAQDYIRTARAKGLVERAVLIRHALRNALLPVVTLIAFQISGLVGGSVLIERVFAIPGVGRLALEAATGLDYPVLQAIVLMSAVAIVSANLLADIAYAVLDPRIRLT